MKRLISTLELPKEEWFRYRKKGITGTDAGAIVGMNPYKSAFEVYQDKLSDDIEDFDNEAMRTGRDLEAYVASRFEEETGKKIRRANAIFYNEEHPIMLADFDRLIVGEQAGLECKTVSPYAAFKWGDGKIPLHYMMQAQHYLAVSGYKEWYICALVMGKELIIRKIERDEDLINDLITIEERFWNENVLKHVMPDPDGSSGCSEKISKLYANSDLSKTLKLFGCDQILERRNEIDELLKKLETEKNAIDQKIKLELGDAAYGITDNFRISWTNYETGRLDTKKLKSERPEIYDEYYNKSTARRFLVNRVA